MNIVLAENFRALFYAPFYACLELGFFRAQGLDVSLVESASPGQGIAGMLEGRTHVVWGGPLRVIKDREAGDAGDQALVAFGEVAARDPFFLIGPRHLSPFSLSDLRGLRLASVSEVPTPWLCLQQDLREAGVDPAALRRTDRHSMAEHLEALARGEVDVVQAFEPFVTQAEMQGLAQVLHSAHSRGWTAYTTFITTRRHLREQGDAFRAMARAIEALPGWLNEHGCAALASVVHPYYPHLSVDVMQRALARYQAAHLWTCRPEISRQGFARLAASMLDSGFVRTAATYEECVAEWAWER